MKTYKVGIIPGTIREVVVDDPNTTVEELFQLAGLNLDGGYTIRRNGESVSLTTTVEGADTGTSFYATQMIKGN